MHDEICVCTCITAIDNKLNLRESQHNIVDDYMYSGNATHIINLVYILYRTFHHYNCGQQSQFLLNI